MSDFADVEDFLGHIGIKGMKWGVRNEPKRTPAQKQERRANRALGVFAGAASIAAVGLYLKANPAKAALAKDFVGNKGKIVLEKVTDMNQQIRKGKMYVGFVLS